MNTALPATETRNPKVAIKPQNIRAIPIFCVFFIFKKPFMVIDDFYNLFKINKIHYLIVLKNNQVA
jgi:hypothetical protein